MMRPYPLGSTFVLLFLWAPFGAAQEEIRFEPAWSPTVGATFEQTSRESHRQMVRARLEGRLVQDVVEEEGGLHRARVEIVSVDANEITRARLLFSEAGRRRGEETIDLALGGRTILLEGPIGSRRISALEEPALSGDQAAFLENLFSGIDDGRSPSDDLLRPDGPVTVGQSWPLALEALAETFDEYEFDLERSTAQARLDSIEERDGVLHATLLFEAELVPVSVPDLEIEEGVFSLEGLVERSVDGSVPYRRTEMEVHIEVRGQGVDEGISYDLEVALDFQFEESRAPLR